MTIRDRWGTEPEPFALRRYAAAVLVVAAAIAIRLAFDPVAGRKWPYMIPTVAVMVAAAFGGLGPGLVATTTSFLAIWFVFVEPRYSFTIADPSDAVGLAIFVVVGAGISVLSGRLRAALASARAQIAQRAAVEETLRKNETLFSAVLDSTPHCISLKDRQGRHLLVNPATLRLLDKTVEQVIGRTAAECFLDPSQGRAILESDLLIVERGAPLIVEENILGPDGNRTFLSMKTPWLDAGGNVIGLLGVDRDITERKQSEEALRRQAALINFSHDAVISADANRIIAGWNDGATEMYGFTEPEAIGHAIHELLHTQFPVSTAQIDEVLSREERWEGELFHTRADGRAVIVESRQILMRDDAGLPSGILEINRDITERKRAEQGLVESRTRLQIAIEAAQLGTWEMDVSSGAITASDQTAALLGFPDPPADLAAWLDRMHDGDRQRVSSELHAAVAGLAPYEVEYRTVAPDGRVRWVAAKGVTITQIGSGPYMMIGVVQDITRRKEAENLLRQREALFRSIAEGIPAIVWTARADGVFEYFNSRACEYTGISPEQSGGGSMFIWDSVHSDDVASAREAWRWAVAAREPYHLESRLRSAAGEYRWFLWHAVPVSDGESDIVRWYGTFTDIHDRKQAEEEVREINAHLEQRVQSRTAQLEAANKELEAFAYSVSHDLRAPLRGIDGWSMALLEDYGGRLDDNAHQYLDRVRSETQRMGILIDDLLQLSRITRVEMRFEPVDLSALAASIAARLREAEPHRDFDFAIAPGLTANGDARLLEVALTNLLSNAAKFTGPCAQARIELGKTGSNGELAFYVRDNGVGFDMAYAHMLFGAFQRLHKTSEFPGTGIGLAIVQRVIGRHGGRVWADAQPGHGATFYFAFAPPAVAQGAPSGP